MFKFELGEVLKDIISGFKGVVVARTEYFTGCNHYSLTPQSVPKDGKVDDWKSFDETRLVATRDKQVKPIRNPEAKKTKTGGPCPELPRF